MERVCAKCGEVATHYCACSRLSVCITCLLSHIGEEPGKSHISLPLQINPQYNSQITSIQQKLDMFNADKEAFESNKESLLLDLEQVQASIAPLVTKLIEELMSSTYKNRLINVIDERLKLKKAEVNASASKKIAELEAIKNTVRQIEYLEFKGDNSPWDSVIWNYSADVKHFVSQSLSHEFDCNISILEESLDRIMKVRLDLDFSPAILQKFIYISKANSCALEVYDVTLNKADCKQFKGDPIIVNAPCFLLPDSSVVVVGTVSSASKVQRFFPKSGKVKSYKPLTNALEGTVYTYYNGCIYSINRVANHVLNLQTKVWSVLPRFGEEFAPLSVGACRSFICVAGNSNRTLSLRKYTFATQTWEPVMYTLTLEIGCQFVSLGSTLVLLQRNTSYFLTEDGIESLKSFDPYGNIKSTICLDGKKAIFFYEPVRVDSHVPSFVPQPFGPQSFGTQSFGFPSHGGKSQPHLLGSVKSPIETSINLLRQAKINYFR